MFYRSCFSYDLVENYVSYIFQKSLSFNDQYLERKAQNTNSAIIFGTSVIFQMRALNRFFNRVATSLILFLFIVYCLSHLVNVYVTRRNIDVPVFVHSGIETIREENDTTLEERPPASSQDNGKISNGSLAVFVFHTSYSILAKLQLHLIRKLAINLVALELFIDGPELSDEMRNVTQLHGAGLHIFPKNLHLKGRGPSYKNADVVNWALATMAKDFLANGTAILLLDGDVFPLSFFSSRTLLNSHDIVCRRYPERSSRYCWIGFICLAPQLFRTIDDFNVSPVVRGDQHYDAGGRTIEYLLKYRNTSFSWLRETILFEPDETLFWGVVNNDIRWIKDHFNSCDKCGPEVFVSDNDNDDIFFYHMISASSRWRFLNLHERLQALYESVLTSPYGRIEQLPISELTASVKKVQKMEMVPFDGNLACLSLCKGRMYANKTR